MIKTFQKCWFLIFIFFAIVAFIGCDEDPYCDERRYPQPYTGYYLFSQSHEGEEIEILYTNGKGHYVVWYSEDECERYVESEFTIESEIPE